MPASTNNLTPQLNATQLKANIDALQKGGVKTPDIQAYVNNYQADGKGGYTLKTQAPPTPQPSAPGAISDVTQAASDISTATQGHAANIVQDLSGKPGFTPALDVLGNVAGEAGDILGSGLNLLTKATTPKSVYDAVTSHLSDVVKAVAGTPQAKAVQDQWNKFQTQNPDVAKNIGNGINIAAIAGGNEAAPTLDDAGQAVKTVANGIQDASGDAVAGAKDALAAKSAAGDTAKVWDTVKPTLTLTETAAAVKDGSVVTRGPLKTVTQVPQGNDLKMIEAAKPYVLNAPSPDIAVHNMQEGIAESATKVRQGLTDSSAIWNKNELKGALNKIAEPITVKSDATLHNTFTNFKRAVIQIADGADKGTVGILDTRQSLDKLVQSEFGPTIYDKSNPMSNVIRSFRNTLNDFAESKIPDGKLPDGSSFKGELQRQSLLYRAIDNTAPKVGKEGSTIISRWIKANPVKAKAIGYGAAAIGGGEAAHLAGF